jgi:hypothetical protein
MIPFVQLTVPFGTRKELISQLFPMMTLTFDVIYASTNSNFYKYLVVPVDRELAGARKMSHIVFNNKNNLDDDFGECEK